MLKWLRKYNTWILVIGGTLLMISFLVPNMIEQLGRRRLSGPIMRLAGEKISGAEFGRLMQERGALEALLGRDTLARVGGGESVDHWVMLTRLAEDAGFVGGVEDGKENLRRIVTDLVRLMRMDVSQTQQVLDRITMNVRGAGAEARLTEDEVYRALSKLGGVLRMRNAYYNALRYSDRRMIPGVKNIADLAEVKYVLVPPERLITNDTPVPSDQEVQAHFERYKETDPAQSDMGIGYRLPARVKLAWITADKAGVAAAVRPDAVEVQKRLLKLHGNNIPSGQDAVAARARIENDIKSEMTDKVMRTLDQSLRGDIEKITRRLEPDGEYKRIPGDWASPDLNAIAHAAATHAAEITGVRVSTPRVEVRAEWQTEKDLDALPRVSEATLVRGPRSEPLATVALGVREIAGPNEFAIQTGVPFGEPLVDGAGNRYYILVLDARKPSAPDSISEVRDRVAKDIQRLAAFEQLKGKLDEFRRTAVVDGLDALAKAPEGVTGPAASPLSVATAKVDGSTVTPSLPALNFPEFRTAVLAAAAGLDPTIDLNTVNPEARTVVIPTPKGLGLVAARIDRLEPMTLERYRSLQSGMVSRLQRDELGVQDGAVDPFSQDALEKRLRVEYLDGREKRKTESDSVVSKAAE